VTVYPPANLSVVVTDLNGCQGTDSVQLLVFTVPPLVASSDTSLCPGESISLWVDATGWSSFLWSTGASSSTTALLPPGTYWVTATDVNGCERSDTVNVAAFGVVPLQLPAETGFCTGLNVVLNTGGGYSAYLWNDGSMADSLVVNLPGTYSVSVVDAHGCELTDTTVVERHDPLAGGMPDSLEVCQFTEASLSPGSGFSTYHWSNGSMESVLTLSEPGTYTVTVTDGIECVQTFTTVVTEDPASGLLFLPNAFTPNGDGLNDRFGPTGTTGPGYHLRVYNRWGELVFETSDPTDGWDGRHHGEWVQEEMFVWVMEMATCGSGPSQVSGSVLLLR
jgi:gliding motility-associated-like protein